MHIEDQPRPAPTEDVVPLINLVFLLLLFFMLAGTLAPRPPFEVESVESEDGPPAEAPRDALYVAADGRIYWRGAPTDVAGLEAALARAERDEAGEPIEVVLDQRLSAEQLFPILEGLADAGIGTLRLVTQRREER